MNPSVSSFIALLHYIDKQMVCGLKVVIERIRARGYQFVSAEECFHGSPIPKKTYFNFTSHLLNQTDPACKHKPQTCMDGDFCSANVTCCQPGTCCFQGYCSSKNCGPGCINGACESCGNSLTNFPPMNGSFVDDVSEYTLVCPGEEESKTKLTFTAYVLIGVAFLLVLIFGFEFGKEKFLANYTK